MQFSKTIAFKQLSLMFKVAVGLMTLAMTCQYKKSYKTIDLKQCLSKFKFNLLYMHCGVNLVNIRFSYFICQICRIQIKKDMCCLTNTFGNSAIRIRFPSKWWIKLFIIKIFYEINKNYILEILSFLIHNNSLFSSKAKENNCGIDYQSILNKMGIPQGNYKRTYNVYNFRITSLNIVHTGHDP